MSGRITLLGIQALAAVSVLLASAASAEIDQNHLRQVRRAEPEPPSLAPS